MMAVAIVLWIGVSRYLKIQETVRPKNARRTTAGVLIYVAEWSYLQDQIARLNRCTSEIDEEVSDPVSVHVACHDVCAID